MLEDDFIMWLSRIDGISIKKKWDILNYFKTVQLRNLDRKFIF